MRLAFGPGGISRARFHTNGLGADTISVHSRYYAARLLREASSGIGSASASAADLAPGVSLAP